MTPSATLFATLALLPAAAGPLPASRSTLVVLLCSGGHVALPLAAPQVPGGPAAVCCAKGCSPSRARRRASGEPRLQGDQRRAIA